MLVLVAWNLAEKHGISPLMGDRRQAAVLLTTLGLTIGRDLTSGILAGCLIAALLSAAGIWRAGIPLRRDGN